MTPPEIETKVSNVVTQYVDGAISTSELIYRCVEIYSVDNVTVDAMFAAIGSESGNVL